MKQADITFQMLGDTLRKDHTYTNRVIQNKLLLEQAGSSCALLANSPT
jgi:hypothetical protein